MSTTFIVLTPFIRTCISYSIKLGSSITRLDTPYIKNDLTKKNYLPLHIQKPIRRITPLEFPPATLPLLVCCLSSAHFSQHFDEITHQSKVVNL